jgi:hypothetical protein
MLRSKSAQDVFEPKTEEQSMVTIQEPWFADRMHLALDPYFEREFFTNLIYCIDRKKSLRDVLLATLSDFERYGRYDEKLDQCVLHLMTCYQATSELRESYQWLPMAQALFTAALFRGDARKPLTENEWQKTEASAGKLEDFVFSIGKQARRVGNFEQAWSHLLFALENRSQRAAVCEAMTSSAVSTEDPLTFGLLMKAFDLCFASAWKQNEVLLKRAFSRFWYSENAVTSASVVQAQGLVASSPDLKLKNGAGSHWDEAMSEELWKAALQSSEAVWELVRRWSSKEVSFDQWFAACQLMRGRVLLRMRSEQWPLVSDSVTYAQGLESATRWDPSRKLFYLATNVCDLTTLIRLVSCSEKVDPLAERVAKTLSSNVSKNQLVLRLDDACERGDREEALDLVALMIEDAGLSHSLSDRLLLMASKQDAWTYETQTIPLALAMTKAYQAGGRMKMGTSFVADACFGLLRFLSDQREAALQEARRRGNYGDGGLSKSPFDVSSGARIVDRFVFNQMRNAQRIQIWPSEGKG